MRCQSCNKFVSYDEPQCEVQSVDVDGDVVRATVQVNLNCADCGETLKSAEIEAEADLGHLCSEETAVLAEYDPDGDQFELLDDGTPEGTSRVETKDRHGKPIKSARYMKTFYGFEMDVEVKCLKCGEDFSVHVEGEEQASAFEEVC